MEGTSSITMSPSMQAAVRAALRASDHYAWQADAIARQLQTVRGSALASFVAQMDTSKWIPRSDLQATAIAALAPGAKSILAAFEASSITKNAAQFSALHRTAIDVVSQLNLPKLSAVQRVAEQYAGTMAGLSAVADKIAGINGELAKWGGEWPNYSIPSPSLPAVRSPASRLTVDVAVVETTHAEPLIKREAANIEERAMALLVVLTFVLTVLAVAENWVLAAAILGLVAQVASVREGVSKILPPGKNDRENGDRE